MIHIKVYSFVLIVLLALFGATMLHSRLSGQAQERLRLLESVSALLPSADPGMDTSARYIRHLALSTPGSAFPDFPAQPDYLPAGMMWPPPFCFWGLTDRMRFLQDSGSERVSP